MELLCRGKFECPSCGAVYQVNDEPEAQLVCCDCEEALEPLDEDPAVELSRQG